MSRPIFCATILTFGLLASTANAQDGARLELSGSYQFLQPMCPGVGCFNYPGGWQGSVSGRLMRWLDIVGEVGENVKTISTSTSGPIALSNTASGTLVSRAETKMAIYDFLAGPRLRGNWDVLVYSASCCSA